MAENESRRKALRDGLLAVLIGLVAASLCGLVVYVQSSRSMRAEVRDHFDLVLMDLQMPVMDGATATRTIRDGERGQRTPIVALTASAMSEDRTRCRQAGMDEFISKPIRTAELDEVLRRYSDAVADAGRHAA